MNLQRCGLTAKLILISFLIAGWQTQMFGQIETGTLVGTVTDATGAVVAGARIDIRSVATDQNRVLQTNADGSFVASALPPGAYELQVQQRGFQTYKREDILISVAQTLRLDITLHPGTLQQEIVVTGAPPQLQTESATLGQVVTHEQVIDLPLNGRNFMNLATLSAGTASSEPGSRDQSAGGFSSNGNRSYDNNVMLDGVDDNSLAPDQRNGTDFILAPPPDAIEEFRVETNGYGPEFGRGGGAAINVVTRSGTNEYHFSVWEFLRNNKLDARNFFDFTTTTPPFKQNQFGGAVGGPIIHDHLFFFGDYQGTRTRQSQTYVSIVPTAQEKLGNFSDGFLGTIINPLTGSPFLNQQISPSQIDPVALRLAQLYPNPNIPGTNTFAYNPVWALDTNQFDIRVDEPINTSNQVFERVSWSKQTRNQPGGFPGEGIGVVNTGSGTNMTVPSFSGAIGYTHIFSPNVVNDFRFGYGRLNVQQVQFYANQDLSAQYGIPGIPFVSGLSGGLPQFNMSDVRNLGTSGCYPTFEITNAYTYRDVLSIVKGQHTMRMGAEFRPTEFTINQPCQGLGQFSYSGQFSGSGFADFLLGLPDVSYLANFHNIDYLRQNVAGFWGDTWRFSRTLTLDFGLRWEYHTPVYERFNAQAALGFNNVYDVSRPVTLPAGFPFPVQNVGQYLSDPQHNDWAPRLGLAYQLNDKTVLRLSYGVFWQAEEIGTYSNPSPGFDPPFYIDAVFPALSTTTVNPIVNALGKGFPPNALTAGFFPDAISYVRVQHDLKDGRVQQWNVAVQRTLGGGTTLELAYAGTYGSDLINLAVGNQATPTADPNAPIQPRRPIPILQTGTQDILSNAYSNYNGLLVTLRRQLSTGLNFNIAYTWSHALDLASSSNLGSKNNGFFRDYNHQDWEYGNADFDSRHRLTATVQWEVPVGRGHAFAGRSPDWLNSIIGGWNTYSIWTLQSGRWFTPVSAVDPSNSNSQNPRPDAICNPNKNAPHTTAHWFNTACFVTAPQGTFGNTGRNIILGPALFYTDLSLVKAWRFHQEQRHVEFRAEAFNVFNRTNFAEIDDLTPEDRTFGQIQTALPPRQIQLALKLYW
ncbi:MAG: TonB-dependent receptor [Acidobacteriaceae bacterium]|nr:TonB-dependent receptor [Acidobacteriaceae bacterium]MBV9779728.1 TonB-dependent receptor [Acidobacteriaceae bacterium]